MCVYIYKCSNIASLSNLFILFFIHVHFYVTLKRIWLARTSVSVVVIINFLVFDMFIHSRVFILLQKKLKSIQDLNLTNN